MKWHGLMMGAAAAMLLAGCEKAEAPAPDETVAEVESEASMPAAETGAEGHKFADWAGRWIGVEGMYVDITPTEPGQYALAMQSDLDTKGEYQGSDSEEGIKFERGGENLTLRASNGDAIGLKYLAGKQDCLIVKPGEGYCRD
ncbi:hypothetical protein [Sphingopyxis sp. MWB1]|uniref:hypothetical protein n=1 Tax=Sphingopyxis sp. MWB1 TaxID=1537715 RepID=UPI00051A80C8|nr:hypothetical protein [Sphingopyxis sp. MWB1]